MKGILLILIAISAPLFLTPVIVYGQANTTETGINSENKSGGFSTESVDLASSNATNQVINTTNDQNKSGGFSTESVRDSMY